MDSIRSCSECKVCASLQRCGWTSTAWEGRVRTHPKIFSVAQSNISAEEAASRRRSQETGGGRATCQSRLNGQAGKMDGWEGLEKKKLSWRDIWQMEGARLSFVIRATYDLLPSPQNLKAWYGEDPACSLCQVPASLRHILSGCTTSLDGTTKYLESWH